MSRKSVYLSVVLLLICSAVSVMAQQIAGADSVVPSLVKFTGTLHDISGKPLTGVVGVTFLLYKEETGGTPLWMETQNVHADQNGHYSVMLGSSTNHGLPAEAFAAGEARWLAVQPSGQAEQARVMLASVPYALKALDAQTLGGRPASAFLEGSSRGSKASQQQGVATEQFNEIVCSSATACKTGFVPLFSSNGGSAKVNDSIITQSGSTVGVAGTVKATGSVTANAMSATAGGVNGNSTNGTAVSGTDSAAGTGVQGVTNNGLYGVYGENDSTANPPCGGCVAGKGVFGFYKQGVNGAGVQGYAPGSNGIGVAGSSNTFGSVAHSIIGTAPLGMIGDSTGGYGVVATSDSSNALVVENKSTSDTATITNLAGGPPLFASGTGGSLLLDGNGNLSITGNISKGGGSFKIDHPLDPANKYLYHSFVESPDMKNIYDGVATLDANGEAVIHMPKWFGVLNRDFRYQLTCLGGFAPVYIAEKVENNRFKIAGGRSGMEVSWQVTGIRQDPYANAHRIPVEEPKSAGERGYYLHPELYGAPAQRSLAAAHAQQALRHGHVK